MFRRKPVVPPPPAMSPPMWHADPAAPGWWRWWDGVQWTDARAPMSPPPPAVAEPSPTLLERQAGQGAAAMAEELRRSAPVRARLAGTLGVHNDERAWRVGAKGEQRVGHTLAELSSPPWTVLHDLPIGSNGANVDHLVIGPPGVFSINTKHHPGGKVWVAERAIMLNGRKLDYLPKARAEGRRVSAALRTALGRPVTVTPMLVVMCERLVVKAQPLDVPVVRRVDLLRWLGQRPVSMRPDDVADIREVALRPLTWGITGDP